jgi:anti-anti-sigma regulatory factor
MMAVEVLASESGLTLTLSGTVDIFDAASLHAAACDAAQRAQGTVVVKLDEATGIDTASSQILVALRDALAARGHGMTVQGTPPAIAEAWQCLAVDLAGR